MAALKSIHDFARASMKRSPEGSMQRLALETARDFKRRIVPDARSLLLRKMPKHARCAEIGVWKGEFSARILKQTRPSELHLIDPWLFQSEFPDRMYGGKVATEQRDMDRIYEDVVASLGSKPQVTIHRAKSDAALGKFPDDYFAWVYIDGNHYYEYVCNDIELAMAKVRDGGFVTGDDYRWGRALDFPVRRAVDDMMMKMRIPASALEIIGDQFIIRKPGASQKKPSSGRENPT